MRRINKAIISASILLGTLAACDGEKQKQMELDAQFQVQQSAEANERLIVEQNNSHERLIKQQDDQTKLKLAEIDGDTKKYAADKQAEVGIEAAKLESEINRIEIETKATVVKARNEEIADASKKLGITLFIAGVIAAAIFWIRQCFIRFVQETGLTHRHRAEANARTEMCREVFVHLRDPNNGLTDVQRQDMAQKALEAMKTPLLTYNPS